MTEVSDVPTLTFVDPNQQDARFRVVLWAAPGEGKSVGAATAPDPILAITYDRPNAYHFARHHPDSPARGKDIREVRFQSSQTLRDVYTYLRDNDEIATVVIDPFGPIYDKLSEEFGTADGETNYQGLNKKVKGFLYSLRDFEVHVVIVAHEKLNDGKKGDGKLYPALGGPALINTVLAESDIVAHVERQPGAKDEPAQYVAQLTPRGNMVGKESTGRLGDRRVLNLSEWFEAAAPVPVDADMPWSEESEGAPEDGELEQQELAS